MSARPSSRVVHAFTSITLAYLPRARLLAESLRRRHPDWVFHVVIVEPLPGWLDLDDEPFDEVHGVDDLGLPGPSWLFAHTVVEACTAVKGTVLAELLAGPEVAAVVYLDPDIVVFDELEPVMVALDKASVVLTPHLLTPAADARAVIDNEMTALVHGTFNLGFVAVAADDTGRDFAQWWSQRLLDHCFDDRQSGLFTDQRWCDLVPSLFERHHILRDPGCNVGPWNIAERRLVDEQGVVTAGGAPLRFFHFSGWDAPGRAMLDRYAAGDDVHRLWDWYGAELAARGHAELGGSPWEYDTFDDGSTRIVPAMRRAYRSVAELRRRFRDPFAVADGYLDWWRTVGAADWADERRAAGPDVAVVAVGESPSRSTVVARNPQGGPWTADALATAVRGRRLSYLEHEALVELFEVVAELEADSVPGEVIEAGVALGGSAAMLAAAKHRGRPLRLFDVFGMIPPPGARDGADVHERYAVIRSGGAQGIDGDEYYGYRADLAADVETALNDLGLPVGDNSIALVPGDFSETLFADRPVALVHVDCDWYDAVAVVLARVAPALSSGGRIIIDDYDAWSGARAAADEFIAAHADHYDVERRARLHLVRR